MGSIPVILLTHGDLDGAACAVVFLCLFADVEVQYHGYDTIDAALSDALRSSDDAIVYLADISPSESHLRELMEKGSAVKERIVILDHHKNNLWASVWEQSGITGRFDNTKCGARLALEWLTEDEREDVVAYPAINNLESFINVVETRDLWKQDSPLWGMSERLQALWGFLGMHRFVGRCRAVYQAGSAMSALSSSEMDIVNVLAEKSERYISTRVKLSKMATDESGDRFAWTVATREGSKIGQALASLDGAKYGAVWNPERNVIELRSVDDFNVGALAKTRGGGGHDRAAGHPLPLQTFPAWGV